MIWQDWVLLGITIVALAAAGLLLGVIEKADKWIRSAFKND